MRLQELFTTQITLIDESTTIIGIERSDNSDWRRSGFTVSTYIHIWKLQSVFTMIRQLTYRYDYGDNWEVESFREWLGMKSNDNWNPNFFPTQIHRYINIALAYQHDKEQ